MRIKVKRAIAVISFFALIMQGITLSNLFASGPSRVMAAPKTASSVEGSITASDAVQTFEMGRKAERGDIKVVDLRGTWRQMGRQYGSLMKDELEDVKAFLDIIIEANAGNAEKTDRIVELETAQTPYRISEFFEGAAETSGMTVQQLQTINAVERIGGLPKCSVAMAWGKYAASDLVIGRNYDYSDYFALLKDDIAVTVYHPSDGHLRLRRSDMSARSTP